MTHDDLTAKFERVHMTAYANQCDFLATTADDSHRSAYIDVAAVFRSHSAAEAVSVLTRTLATERGYAAEVYRRGIERAKEIIER